MSHIPGTWSTAALIRQRDEILLAPYAMHSRDSAGRKHPEPDHPYRGPFQRDRDRILHSSAFRRLSGKMHQKAALERFLYQRVYRHPEIIPPNGTATSWFTF